MGGSAMYAGQRFTASLAAAIAPLSACRTTDQAVTSSTALQDDDVLALAVGASSTYLVEGQLIYDAGTSGNITWGFAAPSGATLVWNDNARLTTAGALSTPFGALAITDVSFGPGEGTGVNQTASFRGVLFTGTASGTLQLRWAQGTSSATSTRVRAGSFLCAWLLSGGGATAPVSGLPAQMPLPTGTPSAGQIPVATGTGEDSAWTTLTAAGFSPLLFGAAGDGTTDDTAAVKDAFAAAAAVFGTVDLGGSKFKITSPLNPGLYPGVRVRGTADQGEQSGHGQLASSGCDLFAASAGAGHQLTFENCELTSSGGHVFNLGAYALSDCRFKGVTFYAPAGYSILAGTNCTFIGVKFEDCLFECDGGTTVSPISLVSAGNAVNCNVWRDCEFLGNHAGVPFAHIEDQSATGYCSDLTFENVYGELCDGGLIELLSCQYATIDQVGAYDTATFTGDLFVIGKGAGGNASGNITIRNSGSRGGSLGAYHHVTADASTVNLILDNVGGLSGSPVYSVPAAQTFIRGTVTPDPIWIPAGALGLAAGAPTFGQIANVGGWILHKADASDGVSGPVNIPSDWTSVKISAVWGSTTPGDGTMTVRFDGKMWSLAAGSVLTSAGTSLGFAEPIAPSTGYTVAVTTIDTVTVTPGEPVSVLIWRDTSSGDTFTGDVYLLGLVLTKMS